MYYRVAEITLDSEIRLPSFDAFACEPAEADMTLRLGGTFPPNSDTVDTGFLTVRRLTDGWFFRQSSGKGPGLIVSGDYTRLTVAEDADDRLEEDPRTEWLVRVAMECMLVRRGYVSLHAAAVSVGGEAFAFTGPSGMGKSTRAQAWREAFGAQLVSGDRPLIHVGTLTLHGVPWDGKEQCFRSVRHPLKAILEVRRSDTVYARAMSFAQRRRLLLRQSFMPMWDTETSTIQMLNIARLARTAQIVRIFCGPGTGDAAVLRGILEKGELKKEEPDMKAKNGFTVRNVVGEYILMPTGDNIGQFKGTVLLNEVAAFVWDKMQSPVSRGDLVAAICGEYDVAEDVAAADLDKLLETLKGYGVIEED